MGKMPNAVIGFEIDDQRLSIDGHELDRRRVDAVQLNAIFACEGLHPTPEFAALQEKYVAGEMSSQQLRKAVDARWKRNG